MTDMSRLATELSKAGVTQEGFAFAVQPIPGDVEVLEVLVSGREELPVFVSVTDDQILCITYLFTKDEVDPAEQSNISEAMLTMNVPMPLSAFGLIDSQYVLFGALSAKSSTEELVHELEILSDNALEALESMSAYLK